jgi:4'-phosphopantetheinyl transferase
VTGAVDLEVVWRATEATAAAAYEALLDDAERAARARLLREEDRRDYTVAHGLLREALARRTGLPATAWRFGRNDLGKPEIVAPAAGRGLRFNLSHTPGLVACVVAAGDRYHEVGIDVEAVRESPRLLALAARYFAPTETVALCTLPRAEQARRFFALWTLKEAWAKARGFGLAAPFDRVAFTFHAPTGAPRVTFAPGFPDREDRWRFQLASLDSVDHVHLANRGYALAVAAAPGPSRGASPQRRPCGVEPTRPVI